MAKGRPFRLPWKRATLAALLVVAALDFLAFRGRLIEAAPTPDPRGDAIIALTGGSGLRISAGVRLLEEGRGERLLISGVNPDITRDELAERAGGSAELYACCIDFGYEAESTAGNAREAAAWAGAHDYRSLVVVTSDYHMPRALWHLGRAMPDTALIPAPVSTRIDPASAFTDPRSFRGLVQEWFKWRVTSLTGMLR